MKRFIERAKVAWRVLRGPRRRDFKGADINRLLYDWIAGTLHPDEEIRRDMKRLRARARELARNVPYAKQFLNLLATNVIGPKGMKLQAKSRLPNGDLDKTSNQLIEKSWKRWARRVTVDRRLSLVRFQQQLIKTIARDGEVFIRKYRGFDNPHRFALQAIDADMIDETHNRAAGEGRNEIRLGVEIDRLGAPLGYWISDYPSVQASTPKTRYFVRADEIIHLYIGDRVNQTRGVCWLHAVMMSLRMLSGYTESELVAARTGAAKMGWIQSQPGEVSGDMTEDSETGVPKTFDAAPGTIETLPHGLEFKSWNPDHPSTAFSAFVKSMLREIATGLGVSYNILANDLEGVNYSSMRSGMLSERDLWRVLQHWWAESFLEEIFPDWLNSALLSGELQLASLDSAAYLEVRFAARGWAWVDPMKDSQAGVIAIQNGLASRQQLLAEQGLDYEDILEQLAEEKKLAAEYDISLTSATPAATAAAPATVDVIEDEEEEEEEEQKARALLIVRPE